MLLQEQKSDWPCHEVHGGYGGKREHIMNRTSLVLNAIHSIQNKAAFMQYTTQHHLGAEMPMKK